jgi:hypothetical protein
LAIRNEINIITVCIMLVAATANADIIVQSIRFHLSNIRQSKEQLKERQ